MNATVSRVGRMNSAEAVRCYLSKVRVAQMLASVLALSGEMQMGARFTASGCFQHS